MKKLMKDSDWSFFWVCVKLGIGALIYRGAIEFLSYVALALVSVIAIIDPENVVLYNSLSQLATSIVSIAAFLLSAVTLWILLRVGKRKNYQPTYWKWRVTPFAPFLIISTVALNFAMAEINSMLMSLLMPNVSTNIMMGAAYEISAIEIVLMFISTAVIPGIVEEIMFRGIMLTNLMPYGKGMAIVCSAFLFGLMHMNPAQFFYTTLMGLVLGYIYVRTRSIWLCIIIHFTNNALGVIQQIIYQNNDADVADALMSEMMIIVAILGIISIGILLIVRAVNRRKSPENIGSFGRICDPELSYEACRVTHSRKMLMFFSPSISLFTVIVFISMITAMVSFIISGLVLGMMPGLFNF